MKLQNKLWKELHSRLRDENVGPDDRARKIARQIILLVDYWGRSDDGIDMEIVRVVPDCFVASNVRTGENSHGI